MKRLALAFCTLSILATTAPAFADCMSKSATAPTPQPTTSASAPTDAGAPKGS
ncbi:hypothetical protein [Azorhizobium sp. AG788]|uniref:hypothetical protein n=1 Tax=Azorhizobium sp. AG788 TaxID=2183897 RepID=UPI003139CBB4